MKVTLINAGLKTGAQLPKADIYLDCRGIANPFHEPSIAAMSGDAEVVQDWVEHRSEQTLRAFEAQIEDSIRRLPIRRRGRENPFDSFTICAFCAHGIHRSRAVKHILKRRLPDALALEEGVSIPLQKSVI